MVIFKGIKPHQTAPKVIVNAPKVIVNAPKVIVRFFNPHKHWACGVS